MAKEETNDSSESSDFSFSQHAEPDLTQSTSQKPNQSGSRTEVPVRPGLLVTRGTTPRPATPGSSVDDIPKAPEYRSGDLVGGRYQIRERLGSGGFGAVYSAHDRDLNRTVAIKQSTGLRSFVAGRVRDEARAVAALNHPNIVQIHDLIEVNPIEIVIVMECLEGVSLSRRLRDSRLTIPEAVKVGIEIANALVHAHEKQLVHSDLKPGNLFVCKNGVIKLLDFGLAVAYFPDQANARIGGTPGYMSPEQIRGESHLIDGRTDVWAFGVVLFEMLTGTRPFIGENAAITNQHTLLKSAPPPRQLNSDIDTELERIVLKCLQPLLSGRYPSAAELREDLLHWLETNDESASTLRAGTGITSRSDVDIPSSTRIGKRGLQPFTELDASAYLSLVPGPRDRNGVPDSIRFWKRWVESNDPHTEYPVGVLYGPSGAGKTSYIRAGLFKQLAPEICRVYVECRSGDLGGRLTQILEKRLQREDSGSSLRDLLHRLRSSDSRRHGFQKMLIVLDQLESWALNASMEERALFAEALRQCDGVQLRVLVVTRDDYWLAAKELFHWLEIPMQEGRNVASVDLLDPGHAQRILESIGREMGTLPDDDTPLADEQQQFIQQAIGELTIDGSVICVHLVMFAQMAQVRKWTPKALRDCGGVSGACGLYFQELFERSGKHSPEYRRIGPAVPHVLSRLLPPGRQNVADVIATRSELRKSVSDAGHEPLFDDCLRILIEDLRIVTVVAKDDVDDADDEPTLEVAATELADAEPTSDGIVPADIDEYRLSHDFLVEPINTCLSRMSSRSWSGRTKARLVEMSEVWSRRQTAMYLPGFLEYLTLTPAIVLHKRSEAESNFVKAATRHHAGRISAALLFFLAFVVMSILAWNQRSRAKSADRRDLVSKVSLLLKSEPAELADRITALQPFGPEAEQALTVWKTTGDPRDKFRAELYLQATNPTTFSGIVEQLEQSPPEVFDLLLSVAQQTSDANAVLKNALAQNYTTQGNRASILLAYLGDDRDLKARMKGSQEAEVDQKFATDAIQWNSDPQLWAELLSSQIDAQIRYRAALILGSYPPADLRSSGARIDLQSLVNDESAVVHSSGRFLAQHLGVDPFSIPLSAPGTADWRLGPDDIPMIRVRPQQFAYQPPDRPGSKTKLDEQQIAIEKPFWCATTPVSIRLYRQFVNSGKDWPQDFDPAVSLDKYDLPSYLVANEEQPRIGTNLSRAYRFCNWLSEREGLSPCYVSKEKEAYTIDFSKRSFKPIPWTYDVSANGYRVPTLAEYQAAALCGHSTGRVGIAAHAVSKQGGGFDSDLRFAQRLFTLPPNELGFFFHDRFKGAWICPRNYTVNVYQYDGWLTESSIVNPPWPGTVIFLAQNASE